MMAVDTSTNVWGEKLRPVYGHRVPSSHPMHQVTGVGNYGPVYGHRVPLCLTQVLMILDVWLDCGVCN